MPNISPVIWSNGNLLRNTFSWLTRIGVAPKFGTLPIVYYQQDQCKAISTLERACFKHNCFADNLRYRKGFIQAKKGTGTEMRWYNIAKVSMGKLEIL